MDKKEARKLVKEFDKAHLEYSTKNWGHFKSNWKKEMKHADLIDGYWYWKSHRVADLVEIVEAKTKKK